MIVGKGPAQLTGRRPPEIDPASYGKKKEAGQYTNNGVPDFIEPQRFVKLVHERYKILTPLSLTQHVASIGVERDHLPVSSAGTVPGDSKPSLKSIPVVKGIGEIIQGRPIRMGRLRGFDKVLKWTKGLEWTNQQLFGIQPFIDGFVEDQKTARETAQREQASGT